MISITPFTRANDVSPRTSERETRAATLARETAYDAELVRRFKAGDESAFEEIVTRYRRKIYSVSLALLRSRPDAEEITQDTFVRANRGIATFRGDSSLATWLYRIAVNLSRNRYRYFRRRSHILSLDCSLDDESGRTFADLAAVNTSNPANEAATDEFTALVAASMEKLEPNQREILLLRNILSRSYEEIAQALGTRVGTVKSRIARARGNLRKQLAKACPEFSADAAPSDWFEYVRAPGPIKFAYS
jgi:RNA polymerase sigma-70 factor (ECF subfamily)